MQNVMMSMDSIRADDVMYWGMGKAKMGMIDVRDIVDVLEKVVVEGSHDDEILDLTGPACISWDDVAKEISEGVGRPVTHVPVPIEAVHTALLRRGAGDWFAEVMRDYSKAYGEGWGDYTTDTVQKVTGKPARSVREFVRDVFAPAFQSGSDDTSDQG
jgi:nucleoside-diphosphate-sugar epimerase